MAILYPQTAGDGSIPARFETERARTGMPVHEACFILAPPNSGGVLPGNFNWQTVDPTASQLARLAAEGFDVQFIVTGTRSA